MSRPLCFGVASLILLGSAVALGDEPAEGVLKAKGLRKSASTYVLAGEAEVQRKLTEARAAYKQMGNALARRQAYERGLRENEQVIRELTERRIALNQQLAEVETAAQNNQLVAMVNGVTDRLNLLRSQAGDEDAKRSLDAQASRSREAYVQAVIDLRPVVDAVASGYAGLAGDEGVKGALDSLNKLAKAKVALGPSRAFLANVALLEKAEASVLSESVDLRKEGGIFWLDVTFNGKLTRPMAFDTGAADVVLPAELAAQIGLRPGKDDPVVRCRVADGSIVEARQMTVPSMRVGKFTVKDVMCTVMPADKANVPPLLGQTFQRNFSLKFSPDSGKLVLSKVEDPEAPAPKAAPARSKGAARPSGKSSPGKAQPMPDPDPGI